MPNRFDTFLHDENIKNFEARIKLEYDPGRLVTLRAMLAQEKARSPAPGTDAEDDARRNGPAVPGRRATR